VSVGRDFERHWRVRVVEDPWVQISVLQAGLVLDNLRLLETEYQNETLQSHRGMWELPDDTLTYFVDRPLEDVLLTHQLQPEEPLTVAVRVQDRLDLRAAICLRVQNLEDGSVATTPPIFLTHFRDRLFASHLTVEIFRRESRDLLLMLDAEHLDVERLSRRLNQDVQETWSQLVDAAEEFGADSVGAAALFVAENTSALA
jgi:hypothetical protein